MFVCDLANNISRLFKFTDLYFITSGATEKPSNLDIQKGDKNKSLINDVDSKNKLDNDDNDDDESDDDDDFNGSGDQPVEF